MPARTKDSGKAKKAKQGPNSDLATRALALQDELDLLLRRAIDDFMKAFDDLDNAFVQLAQSLSEEAIRQYYEERARLDEDATQAAEKLDQVLRFKQRIADRKTQIEAETDKTRRALLEALRMQDILDKNLLLIRIIDAFQAVRRKARRLHDRITSA